MQVMVGGIEDGPGSRAGVHYGDVVISVNGLSVAGKTPAELEAMFSSLKQSTMWLQIDRLGTMKPKQAKSPDGMGGAFLAANM